MTEEEAQHMMERFAATISERLEATLSVGLRRVYERSPGEVGSIVQIDDTQITLDKFWQSPAVPIADAELYESARRPLIDAVDELVHEISSDVKDKALLATRPPVFQNPPGRVEYVKNFGMHIVAKFDIRAGNYCYAECLYGVA
jgi:hypothetical protein